MLDKQERGVGERLTRAHGARCGGKPGSTGNVLEFWASVLYCEVLRIHKKQVRCSLQGHTKEDKGLSD